MRISGKVVEEVVSKGSKSERKAILLDTGKKKFVLRRLGANPFAESDLKEYVGKRVSGTGNLTGLTFIASDISMIKD